MTHRRIHVVLGPPLSGKSTFIKSQFDVDLGDIVVRPGWFLRSAVGISRMSQDENPNACKITDHWVSGIMSGAFHFQRHNGGTLVLDGYPRKVSQVGQLFHLLDVFNRDKNFVPYETTVVVHVLTITPEEVAQRSKDRPSEDFEFDLERIKIWESQVDEVLAELISLSSPKNKVQINHV